MSNSLRGRKYPVLHVDSKCCTHNMSWSQKPKIVLPHRLLAQHSKVIYWRGQWYNRRNTG